MGAIHSRDLMENPLRIAPAEVDTCEREQAAFFPTSHQNERREALLDLVELLRQQIGMLKS